MLYHPFHMVSLSPWPILAGVGAGSVVSCLLFLFWGYPTAGIFVSLLMLLILSLWWWADVSDEGAAGEHSWKVEDGLKWGMVLFILSEVMFFGGWFWGFFHSSTSVMIEEWPPAGVSVLAPAQVPLLNTLILLSSGVSVTLAHHNLLGNKAAAHELAVTAALGVTFTALQGMEYAAASFSISDSSYGGCFFVTTGFHGVHVIIGSLFLLATLLRLSLLTSTPNHHVGMELSIWYWHFVDVVWLFLFSFIYWWSQ